LAYGGTYANNVEMKVENILPFAFPFGIGGPKMKRRVKVSLELCIQMYMQLLLQQFMEGPTILVGMCDCCLQGIQPCKCKGNGHQ
jgi:hypothetical protein